MLLPPDQVRGPIGPGVPPTLLRSFGETSRGDLSPEALAQGDDKIMCLCLLFISIENNFLPTSK